MKKRDLSKTNIKKSMYFAGSISLLVAIAGTAVAVPLYIKIQERLSENITSLTNLSKFITQLTSKLGVSPDNEFTKKLKDGYVLSIDADGKTRIYRSVNGEEALIMNMNPDGTVGTASSMSGLAAQKMISIIEDAKDTIGAEASAMGDILGPYVEESEKTSLEIESAVTGISQEVLRVKNALSTDNADEAAKRLEELRKEGIDTNAVRAEAEVLRKEAQQSQQAFETGNTDQIAAEMARQRAAAEAKIKAAENQLKDAYAEFIIANDDSFSVIDKPALMALSKDELKAKYDEVKNKLSELVSQKASEVATNAQIQRASIGGDGANNVIRKILANPGSFANTFMASFGLIDASGNEIKAQAPNLRRSFYNELTKLGVTEAYFEKLIYFFGMNILKLPLSELTHWKDFASMNSMPSIKVTATQSVNTYTEERSDIARLLGLNLDIKKSDGTVLKGVALLRSSHKHILCFENSYDVIPDWTAPTDPAHPEFEQNKYDTIESLMSLINSKITDLHNDAYKMLIDAITEPNKLPKIQNEKIIESALSIISKLHDERQKGWPTNFIDGFINFLVKGTIFKGKDFNYNDTELINALKFAIKLDENNHNMGASFSPEAAYANPTSNWRNTFVSEFGKTSNINAMLQKWSNIENILFDGTNNPQKTNFIKKDSNIRNFAFSSDDFIMNLVKSANPNVSKFLEKFDYDYGKIDSMVDSLATKGSNEKNFANFEKHLDQLGAAVTNKEIFYTWEKESILQILTSTEDDVSYRFSMISKLIDGGVFANNSQKFQMIKDAFNLIDFLQAQAFTASQKSTLVNNFIEMIAVSNNQISSSKISALKSYLQLVLDNKNTTDSFNFFNKVIDKNTFNQKIVDIIDFIKWFNSAKTQLGRIPTKEEIIAKGFAMSQNVEAFTVSAPDSARSTGITTDGSKHYGISYTTGQFYEIDKPASGINSFIPLAGSTKKVGKYSAPTYDSTTNTLVAAKEDFTQMIIYDLATQTEKVININFSSATTVHVSAVHIDSNGSVIFALENQDTYESDMDMNTLKTTTSQINPSLKYSLGSTNDNVQNGIKSTFFEGADPSTGANVKWVLYLNALTSKIDILDIASSSPAIIKSIPIKGVSIDIDADGNVYLIDGLYKVWKVNLFTGVKTLYLDVRDLTDQDGNHIQPDLRTISIKIIKNASTLGTKKVVLIDKNDLFVFNDAYQDVETIVSELFL